MFITFEANEGAGKTTQIALLEKSLRESGFDVIRTREPGGSVGAEEIRALVLSGEPDRWSAMTEILLFTAARRDHLDRTVLPALKAGKIVLCDRYIGSTLALQVAGGEDAQKIKAIHEIACDGFMPDLTLFLEIDPEVSLQRALGRLSADESAEGRMEAKGTSFHDRVSAEFNSQADEYGWSRVNANQTIEQVTKDIEAIVYPILRQRTIDARKIA